MININLWTRIPLYMDIVVKLEEEKTISEEFKKNNINCDCQIKKITIHNCPIYPVPINRMATFIEQVLIVSFVFFFCEYPCFGNWLRIT